MLSSPLDFVCMWTLWEAEELGSFTIAAHMTSGTFLVSRVGILICGHDSLKAVPIADIVTFYKVGMLLCAHCFHHSCCYGCVVSVHHFFSGVQCCYVTWCLLAFGGWPHFSTCHIKSFFFNIHFLPSSKLVASEKTSFNAQLKKKNHSRLTSKTNQQLKDYLRKPATSCWVLQPFLVQISGASGAEDWVVPIGDTSCTVVPRYSPHLQNFCLKNHEQSGVKSGRDVSYAATQKLLYDTKWQHQSWK